ncbi:hypothetical protein MXD61_17660 [Frankia sp. AgPm24]|uniref:hypothetical protein n=1 Tax=Frankia sp. AgPm24 TaxID=631128 RepID=UPI00200ED130|nr:hypothetical protein [Frankia sp. AgPm24]MCK9923674.1 hypothetical protein [Frankia sp. AgPm24]
MPFESVGEVRNYFHWEDPYWASRENVRRVTARFFGRAPVYYLVHWNEGALPADLDARVADGTVCAADFEGAVLAEPTNYTCLFCDAQLRAAVVDGANPILGKGRAARLRAHTFVRKCPVCHHEIAGGVVEFLPPL